MDPGRTITRQPSRAIGSKACPTRQEEISSLTGRPSGNSNEAGEGHDRIELSALWTAQVRRRPKGQKLNGPLAEPFSSWRARRDYSKQPLGCFDLAGFAATPLRIKTLARFVELRRFAPLEFELAGGRSLQTMPYFAKRCRAVLRKNPAAFPLFGRLLRR